MNENFWIWGLPVLIWKGSGVRINYKAGVSSGSFG